MWLICPRCTQIFIISVLSFDAKTENYPSLQSRKLQSIIILIQLIYVVMKFLFVSVNKNLNRAWAQHFLSFWKGCGTFLFPFKLWIMDHLIAWQQLKVLNYKQWTISFLLLYKKKKKECRQVLEIIKNLHHQWEVYINWYSNSVFLCRFLKEHFLDLTAETQF